MSSPNSQELNSTTFADFVATSSGIILFYKPLCPHCAVMKTVLSKATALKPDLDLGFVNSIEYPDLIETAGVQRIPTLGIVKGGKICKQQVGILNPRETISLFLES